MGYYQVGPSINGETAFAARRSELLRRARGFPECVACVLDRVLILIIEIRFATRVRSLSDYFCIRVES